MAGRRSITVVHMVNGRHTCKTAEACMPEHWAYAPDVDPEAPEGTAAQMQPQEAQVQPQDAQVQPHKAQVIAPAPGAACCTCS
jgi:hypothetical protein